MSARPARPARPAHSHDTATTSPGHGSSGGSSGVSSRGSSRDGASTTAADQSTPRRSGRNPRRKAATGPRPDQLALKLAAAAGPACSRRIEVPLSATATAVALLGAPTLVSPFLRHLATADPDQACHEVRAVWHEMVSANPFLTGHLDALLHWVLEDEPSTENMTAFQRCCALLADVDLREVVEQPLVEGELLGPVYTVLRSTGSQKAAGAFFTPMSVSALMAAMVPLRDGGTFAEPCSGAGAMAVAAARHLRLQGGDPRTITWVLNDIDPVAVALSGINAAVHGFGQRVVLRRGDGLTLGTSTG